MEIWLYFSLDLRRMRVRQIVISKLFFFMQMLDYKCGKGRVNVATAHLLMKVTHFCIVNYIVLSFFATLRKQIFLML